MQKSESVKKCVCSVLLEHSVYYERRWEWVRRRSLQNYTGCFFTLSLFISLSLGFIQRKNVFLVHTSLARHFVYPCPSRYIDQPPRACMYHSDSLNLNLRTRCGRASSARSVFWNEKKNNTLLNTHILRLSANRIPSNVTF